MRILAGRADRPVGRARAPRYWTTSLFANEIVGTANATTAGWGNLGGGVTQMLMVAVYAFMNQTIGLGQEDSWRMSFLVPAFITGVVALGIITISDDSPRGDLTSVRRVDLPQTSRGGATAATWIFRGDAPVRGDDERTRACSRGRSTDRVSLGRTPPRLRRGYFAETRNAATLRSRPARARVGTCTARACSRARRRRSPRASACSTSTRGCSASSTGGRAEIARVGPSIASFERTAPA